MKRKENRYFIALIPPEPLQSKIVEIKSHFHKVYGSKGALRSPGHITLHMPFLWKESKEGELLNLLVHTTKEQSFDLNFNGFGCFEPKTIFINCENPPQLIEFQDRLVTYTKRSMNLFNATHNNGFQPHVTVAFRDLKKEKFELAWASFEQREFKETFRVTSFWLLKFDGKKWNAFREFHFTE